MKIYDDDSWWALANLLATLDELYIIDYQSVDKEGFLRLYG